MTDYGLSKAASDSRTLYYGGEAALPFLWMPPEAIQKRRFSAASDVWAVGVRGCRQTFRERKQCAAAGQQTSRIDLGPSIIIEGSTF